jgi:adenylate cyclase
MSISAKLSNIKSKVSKFFIRKEKNLTLSLLIGLFIAVIVFSIFTMHGFDEFERYLQALIYHIGYKLPKDRNLVTVVKKDETSSSLLNMDINNRRIHASLFNFLGQRQKKEAKSRALNFELLSIKFGLFENIRNQHIMATSYDEWRTFIDDSEEKNDKNITNYNQDNWLSASRQVISYYKKPENKDKKGLTSFIKVTGKTWGPKGANIFKNLSAEKKYLVFPTLAVPWGSEEINKRVSSLVNRLNGEEEKKDKKIDSDKSDVELERILKGWLKLFENLQYSEIVFEFKFFPKFKKDADYLGSEKSFLNISMKLKTYGRDESYFVEPSSVIGFDFVLQGERNKEDDQELIKALNNIKSKVILAARRRTEIIEDEGARDENSFAQMMKYSNKNYNASNTSDSSSRKPTTFSQMAGKKGVVENVFIKPHDIFQKNKERVDYAMIDMAQGSKSYITEAPVIVMVDEKVYDENNNLIATQTIKPSFALKIALEKLDYDNKYVLPKRLIELEKKVKEKKGVEGFGTIVKESEEEIEEIKKKLANAEPSYVDEQKRVFKEIRADFCNGKFNGLLKIKDLEIPLSDQGTLYINFSGSTRKGRYSVPAINSVSYYEALDDITLKEFLKKNPDHTRLDPAFAHRRTLGKMEQNKGERVCIAGPFETVDFDFFSTPVSYPTGLEITSEPLMGIEVHANVIMNFLNRNFLRKPNFYITVISLIIYSIISALLLEMVSPVIGSIMALLLAFSAFSYSYISYHHLGQVVNLAPLLTSILSIWVVNTLVNYFKQRKKANSTKAMFSRFVSKDVVQYMLDNPDLVRPGGTKTELTIFFSDVAGFTTISEGLSPEDLVILLNEYLGAMTDLLFEYGGTLDKFIGDAVMAFWNFPKKQEDHAVKAVLCAIAMQKKIKELQVDWARRGFPKVAARCGINTQDVVVGYMGSQKAQMNFTCMGDGVNLASRLEGANKEYGTMMMVSDNTYQRVKHAVRGRFLDFLAVKGKKEPVKVHELVCKIGDEPEGWFEKTELYDKAIQLHLERKWDEAIATFEEVLKLDPNDGPSKTYITRCNEYKVNPPPEGWDGRYILTHK